MTTSATDATLYVVGNINIDLIMGTLHHWPARGTEAMLEHSVMRPGGSAGNCALALAALGTPHRAVANQGDDHFSPWLAGYFTDSAPFWPRYACETSLTVGLTHPDSERTFFSNQGHITRLTRQDVLVQLPPRAVPGDIVLLCGAFLCLRLFDEYPALLATLHRRGFQVAVDTGWPPDGWNGGLRQGIARWLGHCDYLLLNEVETLGLADSDDLALAGRTLAARLAPGGACVIKRGAEGATVCEPESVFSRAAEQVNIVDTIGAGDSFNAGFLSALLYGYSRRQALRWGIRVAGQAIGSSPRQYPDRVSLQSLAGEE
ncbi:carbohydrate kinase family protein [Acerihabitans arboris]|uniref:Carbohydrate kinase family protein n=1 Tax=Acerihabitans arboris TaxID=2691583 RepID=A0A845SUG2_9GAMM|nr:carbohydrate kinase family protein [Acerihabitans arboris]NDL66091.1 carbohydrate kinase family protein [Acerihabitans arboris]